MKKILQLVGQSIIIGITIGITTALTLFFLLQHLESNQELGKHEFVKRHYTVEKVSFSDSASSSYDGVFETRITFEVKNTNKKKLVRAFVDIEFFDSDGNFLFDYNYGSPFGELYLPPRTSDNVSVDVMLPETVSFNSIDSVTVEVYELTK